METFIHQLDFKHLQGTCPWMLGGQHKAKQSKAVVFKLCFGNNCPHMLPWGAGDEGQGKGPEEVSACPLNQSSVHLSSALLIGLLGRFPWKAPNTGGNKI